MFDRLIHQQAALANRLLGGLSVSYIGQHQNTQTEIIIDKDVMVPDDDGLGVRYVTLATIPLAAVGEVNLDDTIVTDSESFVVTGIASDDGITVEAYVRSV